MRTYPVAPVRLSAPNSRDSSVARRSGPAPLDFHEKSRIRAAAFRATRVYPGPVGELISRELLAVEEWGYRIARGSLNGQLVDHVLKACP